VQLHLSAAFEGEQVGFSDEELSSMTDMARVKKIYKLNSVGAGKGGAVVNGEAERREMEMLVLGSMALRGATN
jgi:EKC/KEOPS complex subunit CGI121/TPRKB